MSLFEELKRRNVVRMAGLYLVGAWLLVQVAGTLLPVFDAPAWVMKTLVAALATGLVPALIFSWAFELTPAGLKRDENVRPEESIAPQTARRMNRMIIAVLVLALGYFVFDKFVLTPKREAAKSHTAPAPNELQSAVNAKSIAVLPFENQNRDPDTEYLCDGIPESIINSLSELPKLKVMSRNSVFHYKGKQTDAQTVGKELKVQTLLTGRVRQRGDNLTIGVELINAQDNSQMWGQQYNRKLADVFAVQEEIAKEVSQKLRLKLTGAEQEATGEASD